MGHSLTIVFLPSGNPEVCNPSQGGKTPAPEPIATPAPTPGQSSNLELRCGCTSCSAEIWDAVTPDGGNATCGARITWLVEIEGKSQLEACRQIAGTSGE